MRYTTYAVPRADLGEAIKEAPTDVDNIVIADKVSPLVPVHAKSATLSVITKESILQMPETGKGEDGDYNVAEFEAEDKVYTTKDRGILLKLTDAQIAQTMNDFDAEMLNMAIGNRIMKVGRDIRVGAAFQSTTTFAAGNSNFSDFGDTKAWSDITADIIGNFRTMIDGVFTNCGVQPTEATMSRAALGYCIQNTAIKAAMGTSGIQTQAEIIANLAAIVGLDKIHVGSATYLKDGVVTEAWNTKYVTVFVNGGASLAAPTLSVSPKWVDPYGVADYVIETFRTERPQQNWIRIQNHTGEFITDKSFGYMGEIT